MTIIIPDWFALLLMSYIVHDFITKLAARAMQKRTMKRIAEAIEKGIIIPSTYHGPDS